MNNVNWFERHVLGYFNDSGARDVEDLCLRESRDGNVCVVADGARMRTKESIFEELSRALRFPAYFGWNWDALNECLWDLSWLPGDDVILVIRNAGELLHAPVADRRILFQIMLSHPSGTLTVPSDVTGNSSRHLHILLADRASAEEAVHGDVVRLATGPS